VTTRQPASSISTVPDGRHRWRCGGCGNLTRFDVVRTSRTREFWHLDLSGAASVEESASLSDDVVSVSCRWCGSGDRVEIVPRPGVEAR
jgi:RNase P subunit RPR2